MAEGSTRDEPSGRPKSLPHAYQGHGNAFQTTWGTRTLKATTLEKVSGLGMTFSVGTVEQTPGLRALHSPCSLVQAWVQVPPQEPLGTGFHEKEFCCRTSV
ncbi:1-Aminocyclopropane-1-Carboxylate Synthase-Like Protein 1 [Manis pentadactyla]|nr:1-Aminocyclopropane-1-Carboxylate Synthase-Like Protein 1 [Manis pentadactyla]